jgi:hypothetical protein
MCLTFARPKRLLEEAVYSFLNQDYAGEKELLVLNDFEHQTIGFGHPQVTVVNLAPRFHTVGEKRNAAAALCRYDLLAVWDDDDIYLPHRLSFSVSHYDEGKRFFKPSKAFILNDGVVSGPKRALFHSGGLWHRSLFDQVGGYAPMDAGEDREIEGRFAAVIGTAKDYDEIQPSEIYYLYRWSGTESYHLSDFGPGEDQIAGYARSALAEGAIESGQIVLNPHWAMDYSQLAASAVTR